MGAEPSRRLFGGQTAVQSVLANVTNREAAGIRLKRAHAFVAGGVAACAVLASVAAIATLSAAPSARVVAMTASNPQPHALVAVAARTLAGQDQSNPTIRRFTGRVGE